MKHNASHERASDDVRDARNWQCDDGELALELEHAVRAAFEHAIEHERGSPIYELLTTDLKREGAIVSSCRLRGRAIARKQLGVERPEARSVYYVPANPGIWSDEQFFKPFMSGVEMYLDKNFSSGNHEWNWDVLARDQLPYVFEFSRGRKPWRWPKLFGKQTQGVIQVSRSTTDLLDFATFGGPALKDAIATAEEAVATRQNLLLIGNSTQCVALARRMTSIMPTSVRRAPPFRAPHYTISTRSLTDTGRGMREVMSEVMIARYGILYLDELAEFSRSTITALRRALDEDFNDAERPLVVAQVTSSDMRVARVQELVRILGFPLSVEVPNIQLSDLRIGTASEVIRKRIEQRENPAMRQNKSAGRKPTRVVAKLAREMTPFEGKFVVTAPDQLARQLGNYMDLANETFLVLFLNVRNGVVGYFEMTAGAVAGVEVHPQGIFQAALLAGSVAGIVTIHNHPSGNPTPSAEDYALWARLREAGRIMGLPVIDNLVIAGGKYFSQSEEER